MSYLKTEQCIDVFPLKLVGVLFPTTFILLFTSSPALFQMLLFWFEKTIHFIIQADNWKSTLPTSSTPKEACFSLTILFQMYVSLEKKKKKTYNGTFHTPASQQETAS